MTMRHLAVTALILICQWSHSQVQINGYVTEMPSIIHENLNNETYFDNLIHNRLNFSWIPSDQLSTSLELRNQLMWGETVKNIPYYEELISKDNGWLDLSTNLFSGNSYVLNTMIDRLWLDYTKNKWQIRVGRQRVNWGMTMIWNPNDIFNAYSYFDFDYPERPGIDGIRFQYYTDYSSSLEAVLKTDHENKISAAVRYRFNKWNYDFQTLAGYYNEDDWVLGLGWSGQIEGAGFYGELTSLIPKTDTEDLIFIGSIGANYTFKNSLMLQTEMLYSSNIDNSDFSFFDFYTLDASVKTLSISDYSLFGSASYPVTPLLSASLAFMWYPGVDAGYIGPSLDYSLRDDLYLSYFGQVFSGQENNTTVTYLMNYIRLKWNF